MPSGSMKMHSSCPGGAALGCRLSLKTAILKRPKRYVLERCNLYKETVCGPSFQLEFYEPLYNTQDVTLMLSSSMTMHPRCPGGVPWVADYH